ncbi:MAG: aldo/keto reductase [Pirellulaceae bacterium]
MPVIGLGTWKIKPADAAHTVQSAIEMGYRHLDCACDYGNEAEVGEGIQAAIDGGLVKREELWITSKLWNTYHRAEHVRPACLRTLLDLRVDYLDLYLVHFPISLAYVAPEKRYPPGWIYDTQAAEPRMRLDPVPLHETWRAMEQLVEEGLVRNLGVCNFNSPLILDLVSYAEIQPAMLQVEMHPLLAQARLLRLCLDLGLAVTAFSSLGAPSYVELGMASSKDSLLRHPMVSVIADNHGRTQAQVLLRWGTQRGTIVIPKSSRPERLRENLESQNFTLADDEMAALNELDRHRRFNDPGQFCEEAFGKFLPIFD